MVIQNKLYVISTGRGDAVCVEAGVHSTSRESSSSLFFCKSNYSVNFSFVVVAAATVIVF